MSGHLLSTVNPEASAAIQPDAMLPKLPDVGDLVVYHMRQGFGRQGRTRFAALVQGRGDRDTLNLTVIIDAGDFIDEQFVSQIGVGNEFHCWEWPDDSRRADGFRGTVAALHQRIGELEGEAKTLRDCVLGDFDVPGVSIIHIMQDFETRLRLMRDEIVSFREHALSEPAVDGKKTKGKGK
jgi:hypothetical protein